jgi:hypothetical protein
LEEDGFISALSRERCWLPLRRSHHCAWFFNW